jgi:hypothetical protein
LTSLEVPTTILAQLGGNRFLVMTGARNLLGSENSLTFQLPGNLTKAKINKCVITLTPLDLYTVEFYRVDARKGEFHKVSEATEVYADNLQEVFTEHTGLYTHL